MERTKMPNVRKGGKVGFEPGLTWLRVRRSTTEIPRSIWACIDMRRGICGQKSDGAGVAGKRRIGRLKPRWNGGTISRRENCQEMKPKTGLNGGVSYETSTPHKRGQECGRRRRIMQYVETIHPRQYWSIYMTHGHCAHVRLDIYDVMA